MFIWFILFPQYAWFGIANGIDVLKKLKETRISVMENLTVLCTKDIIDLDQEIKGMTLWEYILAYKSTHTGKNLIHTINKSQSY